MLLFKPYSRSFMRTAFHVILLALGLCCCPLLQAAAPVDPYNELFPEGTQITFIGQHHPWVHGSVGGKG